MRGIGRLRVTATPSVRPLRRILRHFFPDGFDRRFVALGNVLNIAQIEKGSPCLVEVLCC
jgi:hypothetical protein